MSCSNEDIDYMSIGHHCAEKSCRQLDFLPFKCDHCKQDFCLQHRVPSQHSCGEVVDKDSRLPQCPLCQKYIVKGEDDNTQVEQHIRSGCKDLVFTKRTKNKCSVNGCKHKNLIPLHCDDCLSSFCVRHRHPGDHQCLKENRRVLLAAR